MILVTHEEDVAGNALRIIRLRDGRIASDHPTEEDPMHQAYLQTAARNAVHAARGALPMIGPEPLEVNRPC